MAGRHQGVFISGLITRKRTSHINPFSICAADLSSKNSKQRSFTNRDILFYDRTEGLSLHIRKQWETKIFQKGCRKIDGLDQLAGSHILLPASGIPDKEGRMGYLSVKRAVTFGPLSVFRQKKPMIGINNQHRILPEIIVIHGVQYFSQIFIAKL